MTDTDLEFQTDLNLLYAMAGVAVRNAAPMPRIEAAAANAADVPSIGLRFPDRARALLDTWPARII